MNKDTYLEMCETLGTEPREDQIPIELEDLPVEVHEAYKIYHLLPDYYVGMGDYIGKQLQYIPVYLDLLEVDDRLDILKLVILINSIELESRQKRK